MSNRSKDIPSLGLDYGSIFHLQISILDGKSSSSRKEFQRQIRSLQGRHLHDPLSEVLAERYRAPRQPRLRRKGD